MDKSGAYQRAVVVDSGKGTSRLIASLLVDSRKISVISAEDEASAWSVIDLVEPQLVFISHSPIGLNGPSLARKLRWSDLRVRKNPVIMLARDPTAAEITAARDSGVDEVLLRPFTAKDLLRRVDAVTRRQRDWVEGIAYVGPDRRRFNSGQYQGQRKRRIDREALTPEDGRIGQALKIMKAAIEAIDLQPRQAVRALYAQSDDIQEAALAMGDFGLAGSAKTLRTYLDTAVSTGRLDKAKFAADLQGMFGLQPEIERKIAWVG